MALAMNTLSGFLRIGPQEYPPRPNAVQIIERGPHGMRLAADPVASRFRQPRGSGFRFWIEDLNVPADVSWNPPQRLVGLLGLGGASSAMDRMNAILEREKISSGQTLCALDNQKAELFNKISLEVFPTKESLHKGLVELGPLVKAMRQGDLNRGWSLQALACLIRGSLLPLSKPDRAKLRDLGLLIIIKKGELREDGKPMISPEAVDYKTGKVKLDPKTSMWDHLPAALDERVGELLGEGEGLCSREQLRVPVFGKLLCRGRGEPRQLVRNPLITAAVVAGGAIVLYGLGKGIAGAIAKRR